jgi:hypothetical protein
MPAIISRSDITAFGAEPRILDLTLAARLGMVKPHKIRELIAANIAELVQHGEVSSRREETSPRGGRPGTNYYLNEAQALLVCMFSRTPKAAIVRKALIEVFMAYRRGEVSLPSTLKPLVRPTEAQITEMRRLWAEGAWPLEHLARRYNMSVSGVRGHLTGIERYSERPDPDADYILKGMLGLYRTLHISLPERVSFAAFPSNYGPDSVIIHATPLS